MSWSQAPQRHDWKRSFYSFSIAALLALMLSSLGCSYNPYITNEHRPASYSIIRPIDVDAATAEKIGREALEKLEYEEIIKLAEKAGFVEYKSNIRIQLASYGSAVTTGFVPVFSRYALAAAVTSQADSPLPGPADIAAVGVVVIGLVDAGLLDGYLLDTLGGWLFSKGKIDVPAGPVGGTTETAGSRSEAAGAENAAYEEARAGGRHAGTLKNYAGRSNDEIEKSIGSYERQVEIHKQKIANPEQFAERWGQMGAQEQAGLLNKWRIDAARNQELANVLRGLLKSR